MNNDVKLKNLMFLRIKSISFKNFRNIEFGEFDFPNSNITNFISEEPSMVGLYGQNGSGKTSVIMCLEILKKILCGESLGKEFESCIMNGKERCSLAFTFTAFFQIVDKEDRGILNENELNCLEIYYDFEISNNQINPNDLDNETPNSKLKIENEILKMKNFYSDNRIIFQKRRLFDTTKENSEDFEIPFGTKQNYQFIVNENKVFDKLFKSLKILSNERCSSYIFSNGFLKALENAFEYKFVSKDELINKLALVKDKESIANNIQEGFNNDPESMQQIIQFSYIYNIVYNLKLFGKSYLYVVNTSSTGITNINENLPLILWKHIPKQGIIVERISLNMDKPTLILNDNFERVKKSLNSIGYVLSKVIPGLSLEIEDLGSYYDENNKLIRRFEVFSNRNGLKIPVKYESDGVRRLISIMSLIIAAYNEQSFTIAIDEIDSGIFEYLLGEILSIMSKSMKGQFIFTSHNLRPLEVLPAKFLYFTTVDNSNKFTTISHRGNSNLRDTYLRKIILGNNEETIYNHTDKYEIELALYKAGH